MFYQLYDIYEHDSPVPQADYLLHNMCEEWGSHEHNMCWVGESWAQYVWRVRESWAQYMLSVGVMSTICVKCGSNEHNMCTDKTFYESIFCVENIDLLYIDYYIDLLYFNSILN